MDYDDDEDIESDDKQQYDNEDNEIEDQVEQ
jgi:hypothetical protein